MGKSAILGYVNPNPAHPEDHYAQHLPGCRPPAGWTPVVAHKGGADATASLQRTISRLQQQVKDLRGSRSHAQGLAGKYRAALVEIQARANDGSSYRVGQDIADIAEKAINQETNRGA